MSEKPAENAEGAVAYLLVGLTARYLDETFDGGGYFNRLAARRCAEGMAFARKQGFVIAYGERIYHPDGTNIEFMRKPRFEERRQQYGAYPLQADLPRTLEYPAELSPKPGDVRVPRRSFSAFFGTDLSLRLNQRGVKRVVVAGANAGVCVKATSFDAIGHGFRVAVHEGALGDVNLERLVAAVEFFRSTLSIPLLGEPGPAWTTF